MAEPDLAAPSAFDPARLLEIFDGDATAIREVIDETIVLMQDILAKLAAAKTEDARPGCAALVHELKGLSGNVGAGEMHALSGDMEKRLRDGSRDFDFQWFAGLNDPYRRFVTRTEQYLTSGV